MAARHQCDKVADYDRYDGCFLILDHEGPHRTEAEIDGMSYAQLEPLLSDLPLCARCEGGNDRDHEGRRYHCDECLQEWEAMQAGVM
jgi:hypothetical protein